MRTADVSDCEGWLLSFISVQAWCKESVSRRQSSASADQSCASRRIDVRMPWIMTLRLMRKGREDMRARD
jgi:hypothetical protein